MIIALIAVGSFIVGAYASYWRATVRQRVRVKAMWLELANKTTSKGAPLTVEEIANVVEYWVDTASKHK